MTSPEREQDRDNLLIGLRLRDVRLQYGYSLERFAEQVQYSDPVSSVIVPMLQRYANSGNPWDNQDYQDSLFSVNEWNGQGLYARAVSDWLLGSQTTRGPTSSKA